MLELIKLELFKFAPFDLSGIEHLVYTPRSSSTVILGCNGSGKTHLMKEIVDPMGYKNKFHPGGYKKLVLRKGEDIFYLHYTFSEKKATYAFIKNNEDLNPTKKISIQTQLIEEELGLDPFVLKIMLGEINFSSLRVKERKDFLMRLSEVDVSYGLELLETVKRKRRDLKGAYRHSKDSYSKLTLEKERLTRHFDAESYKALTQEKEELSELLSRVRNEETPSKEDYDLCATTLPNQLKQMYTKYERLRERAFFINKDGLDIEHRITRKRNEINELGYEKRTLSENFRQLKQEIEKLETSLTEMNDEVKVKKETSKPFTYIDEDKPALDKDAIEEFFLKADKLCDSISQISSSDILESKDSYDELKKQEKSNQDKIFTYYRKGEALNSELSHLLKHDLRTCPKCSHTFRDLDVEESYIQGLKDELEKLRGEFRKVKKEQQELSDKILGVEKYKELENKFKVLFTLFGIKYTKEFEMNPLNFTGLKSFIKEELIERLERDEYKQYEEKKRLYKDFNRARVEELVASKKEELKVTAYKIDRIEVLSIKEEQHLKSLLKDKDALLELKNLKLSIAKALTKHSTTYRKIASNRNKIIISKGIRQIEEELCVLESLHDDCLTLDRRIFEHEEFFAHSDNQLKDYARLMESIETLISSILITNITPLIDKVNSFLNEVLSYDLEIQVCEFNINEGDLSYIFPVHLDNREGPKDITDCSEGQIRLIDFCFRVLAILALNLGNHPIMIDESEKNLDETHKLNLANLIQTLVEEKFLSQVYIASHDLPSHQSYRDSDVLVLNELNITLPEVYNLSVKLS